MFHRSSYTNIKNTLDGLSKNSSGLVEARPSNDSLEKDYNNWTLFFDMRICFSVLQKIFRKVKRNMVLT